MVYSAESLAYSSSCRPVYDGVNPHWRTRGESGGSTTLYYQKSESRPDHIFVCVALLALEKTHPVGRFPWMVFDQSLARQISIKNHGMKNQSENVGRSILVCHQLCFRTRRETLSEVLLDFFGNSSHSEMLLVQ